MTILLFQWKTVNDVTNTQRTPTVFLYKGGGIKVEKRGFQIGTHTDNRLQKSEIKLDKMKQRTSATQGKG